MGDPTQEFFAGLAARGHEPLLQRISGTLRFDLQEGGETEHWYVTVRKGDVDVSHADAAADCQITIERSLFAGMASGKINAVAAALRDLIAMQGNVALILEFQRLFPGPSQARDERRAAGYARRQS